MSNKTKKTTKKEGRVTPLMQQYFGLKAKYPEAIMLFRVGDFYETFAEDAITASRVLGITLTKRNNGGVDIELAGFPYHSLDTYLPRLVRAGHRVAICEQLEKPSKEKKIVKRGVTEIVTPGIAVNDQLLDHKTNNFLAAVAFGKKNHHGIALLDISTGEFIVSEGNLQYVDKLLQGLKPNEVLFARTAAKQFTQQFGDQFYTFTLDDWVFTSDYAREKLLAQFEVQSLKGFGVEELEMAQMAAGAVLHYLATTENTNLKHVNAISRIEADKYVWLDRFTIRNLELLYSQHENGVTLIDVLDKTVSPMGARLLKKWVVLPLKMKAAIQGRLEVVEFFIREQELKQELDGNIRLIGDLERLISKVPLGKVNPREVVQLKRALKAIAPIKESLAKSGNASLEKIADGLNPCVKLKDQIEKEINEDPPVLVSKGNVINDGVNEELDDLRNIINNGKELLLDIQREEAEKTGITNLKIGFNNVFGYYLEVTNKYKNQGLIPDNWVRKQTLTNAERYITDELKKLESKILGAEEKIQALESRLFQTLVMIIADYIRPIQHNASLIAQIDCLMSFAKIAIKNEYCRPTITEDGKIDIKEGRHPVIEQQLPLGESYIPNDVYLDNDDQQILMITGPNMAGKSALLRQTALICLMGQMGSFVPAKAASIGIVDKVFTRVGASDNISSGESTFMVEMNETASIMNNISDNSLILLDEIGRGTSTFDGVSIAWSIAEFLHTNGQAKPKTLFATHYHELNELNNKFPRIKNFHISTKEVGQKVIFLRKLVAGGSNHSFGIYVAKMAGMPKSIVKRAADILKQLEQHSIDNNNLGVKSKNARKQLKQMPEPMQLSFFEANDPVGAKLKEVLEDMDVNGMTPIEALMKLNEMKGMVE
ncbi:MAG: DNA mismatch repair protein MutS [Polaribacter sp.]